VIRVLLLYLLFGLNGKSLFAQTAATGALRGSLSDPSGGVLPGVSIKVTSTTTGETRTALTQGNGAYLIPLLSPGAYRVEASSKNFKTAVFEDVRVDVTETETLDIRLQIGSITETVTVKAEPPQLETTSSALATLPTREWSRTCRCDPELHPDSRIVTGSLRARSTTAPACAPGDSVSRPRVLVHVRCVDLAETP